MKEIKINGETFTPKYNLRAMFLYEKMSGHSGFETTTTEDNFMLLYSMLKGSKRDTTLTYDEFIDACDDNPELVNELSECIISQAKANESMMEQVEGKKAKALSDDEYNYKVASLHASNEAYKIWLIDEEKAGEYSSEMLKRMFDENMDHFVRHYCRKFVIDSRK